MAVQTSISDMPSAAFAGDLVGINHQIDPMKSVEASAEIPFGYAVAFKASGATDQDALLPLAANSPIIAGIVVKSDVYDRTYSLADGSTGGELGTTGLKPGAMLNVLRQGRIWAVCVSGCTPGARLYVQKTVNGGTRPLGALDSAADGMNSVDATKQGVWKTTASAGGLAILEVDFTNAP